jgi:hypothetical protein
VRPGIAHEGHHADQQKRRGFAQRLRQADDRAGQDAGRGQRQNVVEHALHLGRAEPSAACRIDGGTARSEARVAMMIVGSVISVSTSRPRWAPIAAGPRS